VADCRVRCASPLCNLAAQCRLFPVYYLLTAPPPMPNASCTTPALLCAFENVRDCGFIHNGSIIFFVSGQGLLCIYLVFLVDLVCADCSSRLELTSMRKTQCTTPALTCKFENAGLLADLFPKFSTSSLLQVSDSFARVFWSRSPRYLPIARRVGSRRQCPIV
jgi:hypothetical protein